MRFQTKKAHLKSVVLRSLLIAACVSFCFLLMRVTVNGFVLTSIGASAFIAFAFPQAESARPRYLVGGYACGIVAGLIGYLVYHALLNNNALDEFFSIAAGSILSVFIASVFMMALGLQHPPSAALAISIVIDAQPLRVAVIAFICVTVLALVKQLVLYFAKKRETKTETVQNQIQEKPERIQ